MTIQNIIRGNCGTAGSSLGNHQSHLVRTLGRRAADSTEQWVPAVHDRNHRRLEGHRIPLAGLHILPETVEVAHHSHLVDRHIGLEKAGWPSVQLMEVLVEAAYHHTEGSRPMVFLDIREPGRFGGCS